MEDFEEQKASIPNLSDSCGCVCGGQTDGCGRPVIGAQSVGDQRKIVAAHGAGPGTVLSSIH